MILFLSNAKNRKTLSPILSGQSVFLFSAPMEVGVFLFLKEDVGGVILDAREESAGSAFTVALEIRKKDPRVPIAWLSDRIDGKVPPSVNLLRVTETDFQNRIVGFCKACSNRDSTAPLSGYFLSETTDGFLLLGYPLKLSEAENDLLRLLLYRYPRPTSAENLLQFSTFETGQSIQKLYARLSHINRVAKGADTRKLILRTPNGYVLRDGLI